MRRLALLALALSFATACGGGGDDGSSADTTAAPATVRQEAATTAAATPASSGSGGGGGELPAFSSDFERVCTTQVGFAGATPYDGGPGVHPVIVFTEQDDADGEFIESGASLPEGWLVVQDGNFEDNSDLAPVQLVACADRTASTPNGTVCEFDDDGEKLTLNLVDATYDLIVYEATTGAEVGRTTVEAATTDCPFFVFVDEGQTDYVNTPTEDDLVSALEPFVDP